MSSTPTGIDGPDQRPDDQTSRVRRRRRLRRLVPVTLLAVVAALLVNAVAVDRHGVDATVGETVPLDGGTVHVHRDGPRDAPVLVLIHGLGGSTHWWDALVPYLTGDYHVIRIDLLGHGRSAKPTGGGYTVPEQGARVGAALDRLGVEHAVVIGHSTGGSVATALAEQRPDLVTALALVDTGPRLDAFVSDGPAGRLLLTPVLGQLLWRFRTDDLLRRGLSTGFSRPGYVVPQQLVDDARATTFHAFTATSQAAEDYLTQRELPDRLSAAGKPLLVVFGRDDRRWRSSSAEEYRAVPGAIVDVVPDAGHSPMLEDPSRTATLLRPFLARHATRGR